MLSDPVDLVDSLVCPETKDLRDPLVCLEYQVPLAVPHKEENRVYRDLLDLR